MRGLQGTATPMFPAVEDLLALFKDSCKELVDLRQQSADSQRKTASQTIELIKFNYSKNLQYLMEFNSSPGDLMELSPLFSDDSRVAEAASIAQKLRKLSFLYLMGLHLFLISLFIQTCSSLDIIMYMTSSL
ncbi:hypothetical protein GW17_00007497 [Ensete ventricosum]|nr:hypothetical protein GW17_00007497 [Ensete ventricosum]